LTPLLASLARRLRHSLGSAAVIADEAERRTYESDALTSHRRVPGLVVLPESAEGVQETVRACLDLDVPFVARGSGTGLAGGALPLAEGVLIVTTRMNRILEIDIANQRAVVEPGVINLAIDRAAGEFGHFYAPDPASRQVCTIGGDVAENSGGVHSIRYGRTAAYVTGLEVCTPDGELVRLGAGKAAEAPGYDLTGVFTGSAGTLGIATKIVVRLLRTPESVAMLRAAFRTVAEAGTAASAIIAAGLSPTALEIMDAPLPVPASRPASDPTAGRAARPPAGGDHPAAGAVLIVELAGPAVEVRAEAAAVCDLCGAAFEIREASGAAGAAEREAVWAGYRSAVASGRNDPYRWTAVGVPCWAGRPPCLTGEADLETMRLVRRAFDPGELANPGKVLPAHGAAAEGARPW
jgi:glycolate oxidase